MKLQIEGWAIALDQEQGKLVPPPRIEIIGEEFEPLQINLMDREGFMVTRLQIAVEKGVYVVRVWEPEFWHQIEPHQKFIIAPVDWPEEEENAASD